MNPRNEIWIFATSNLGQKASKKNHQLLKHPAKKYDQKMNTLFQLFAKKVRSKVDIISFRIPLRCRAVGCSSPIAEWHLFKIFTPI